jgi:pseudaminic acid cytidylyltransferase
VRKEIGVGPYIAIIPARGGSKRIPRKNIRPMAGMPLIGRAIDTAHQSGLFERVVVSTDDDEIAEISRSFGAEVPFRRPEELSDDLCPTRPVIAHAIRYLLEARESDFAATCVMYPAAVLALPSDLRSALDVFRTGDVDQVFSAARFPAPIQRSWLLSSDGLALFREPENFNRRSQDLLETFYDAGQFYWSTNDYWLSDRPEETYRRQLYELPRDRVCDIDTEDDWQFTELLLALRSNRTALRD